MIRHKLIYGLQPELLPESKVFVSEAVGTRLSGNTYNSDAWEEAKVMKYAATIGYDRYPRFVGFAIVENRNRLGNLLASCAVIDKVAEAIDEEHLYLGRMVL